MSGEYFSVEFAKEPGSPRLQEVDRVFKDAENSKPFMGWVRLPDNPSDLPAITRWLKGVRKNQTTLCVLGIGGSCLGARAVYDFLQPSKEVLFFDNIDGHSFENRLNALDLKKTHFLAISKSGETSETLFQLAHIFDLLSSKKLKAKDHVSVITEEKPSTLRRLAQELELASLPVPFDVGGRFSVLTAVGLAPLLWAGVPVKKLLQGAQWAKSQKAVTAQLASFYMKSFQQDQWISVFWAYVDGLKTFGLWLEQLWAESLAKAKDRRGSRAQRASTPISCIGATDQHSLLQQFTEGARDKSFMFLRNLESETSRKIKKPVSKELSLAKGKSVGELLAVEAAATQKILYDLGLPMVRLTLQKHDPESIGALIFLFEMLVATLGECLNLNAFDQPGVEAVKKVTLGTLGDPRYADQALNKL